MKLNIPAITVACTLLSASLGVLTGCSRKSTLSDSDDKNLSPRHGGIVVFATTSDPKSFNDIIAAETSTSEAIGHIFEGLTRTNGVTADVEPALATSWEHSADGLVWTFYLRGGVTWFDGKPFSADDVVFTYRDLIYNKSIPCSMRDLLTIEGKEFKVEKIDPLTVRVTTPVPYAPLLRHMGQSILPKHKLETSVKEGRFPRTWGVDTDVSEIIGTGPYRLVEYIPSQKLVYERNKSYWKKDSEGYPLPYIKKIVTIIVPDSNVEIAKFQAGEIDSLGIRPRDYAYLKPLEKKGKFTIYDLGPSFSSSFLFFNQDSTVIGREKAAWFRDKIFRQAVAAAIDYRTLIENVYFGFGTKQHSPMSEGDPLFYNPNVKAYGYDPAKARELFASAGFKDHDGDGILEKPAGVPVKFILVTNADNMERKDMAVIIEENLKAVGLGVMLRPLDFNNLVQKIDATRDWECMILGLSGGALEPHGSKTVWDPAGRLHMWDRKPDPDKKGDLDSPDYLARLEDWKKNLPAWEWEILDCFNKGVQELDLEKRKAYYFRWQEMASEELPLIYLVTPKNIVAVRDKFVGIKPSGFAGVFHNFDELYIRAEDRRQ